MRTSELSHKISVRLAQDIAAGAYAAGEHIGAQQVADRFDVSRTPAREALTLLCDHGVLTQARNRGHFVSSDVARAVRAYLDRHHGALHDEYQQLADDWMTDKLPEEMTELALRERYGLTKARVNDLMLRAAREGWAERKEGYGWRFLPVAKTPEAFDQVYRFRMAIEPAAMLEPSFEPDRKVLSALREQQLRILNEGWKTLPDETLLDAGAEFHETLIRLSGNPFFIVALQRANRMRRLMEYRAKLNRARLVEQYGEHLQILDLLAAGEVIDASYLLRRHLSGALKRKSPVTAQLATSEQGSSAS